MVRDGSGNSVAPRPSPLLQSACAAFERWQTGAIWPSFGALPFCTAQCVRCGRGRAFVTRGPGDGSFLAQRLLSAANERRSTRRCRAMTTSLQARSSGSGFATVATKLFAKRTTLRFGAYRDECIRSLRRKFSLSCSRNACSSGFSANASNVLPRGHDLESIVVDPVQVPAVGQEVFLHGEHFLDPAVEWAGFDDL